MKDIWAALEEHTRAWHALDRQGLADAVWADYVTARFSRTGDPRALQFLLPYLNRGDRDTRLGAIDVTAQVFQGAGPKAISDLDYFTRNTDSFLADRAVHVVGAAMTGWPAKTVLSHLSPYLNHRSRFIQRQAMTALSRAAFATADDEVLAEIERVAQTAQANEDQYRLAVARVFAGKPTERAYLMVVVPQVQWSWRGTDLAVGILLRGASADWHDRGCEEFFEPRLHWQKEPRDPPFKVWPHFTRRAAIQGLCRAAAGKGMKTLYRMLHLRSNACTLRALLSNAPECFAGADVHANRGPLLELLGSGDVQQQRIAAACLGRLLVGSEDEGATTALKELCGAQNRAVAAAAIGGLGMMARCACDQELHQLCLDLAREPETATSAIRALGMIFQGSGRSDVLTDIRENADVYRHRRIPGRKHCRPLAKCFHAAGLVYQGTGSMEPLEFLLDALTLSRARWCAYRWSAGRALVMIEFPSSTIARVFGQPWV